MGYSFLQVFLTFWSYAPHPVTAVYLNSHNQHDNTLVAYSTFIGTLIIGSKSIVCMNPALHRTDAKVKPVDRLPSGQVQKLHHGGQTAGTNQS
jgi:hypothetical protein